MKRNFFALAGLSIATLVIVGCTQHKNVTPAVSPTTQSPIAASSNPTNSRATETAQASNVLRSGTFVSGEHPTSGSTRIVEKDGKQILELDETFKTSTSGPDLVVVLHRSPNVIGSTTPPAHSITEGDYVILAPLQEFNGAQSYEIPNTINLQDFQSAVIWCRRFNATFGAARLQ
jgi:Electron transfer DM13